MEQNKKQARKNCLHLRPKGNGTKMVLNSPYGQPQFLICQTCQDVWKADEINASGDQARIAAYNHHFQLYQEQDAATFV